MHMLIVSWLLLGLVLGAALIVLARATGERRTFAYGLVVAALIYVGFAVFGGAGVRWLALETLGVGLYSALAALGLYRTSWWLAVGWLVHPAWDAGLHLLGGGSEFAPQWYAVACISFDVLVAGYIAVRAWRRSGPNKAFKPTPLRGAA
jgi:hypothetical protein